MQKYISLLLSALLLFSCCGCSDTTSKNSGSVESITIDRSYTLVSPKEADATAVQAAQCILSTLDIKMSLSNLKITNDDPGNNAIVFQVDNTMEEGAYKAELQGNSLYLTAQNSNILLLTARELRQRMLDSASPVITQQMCAQLTGKYDITKLPFRFLSQNILFKDIEGGNTVEDRKPRFKMLMQEYCPDIVGIQEYNAVWKSYITSEFGEIYTQISPTGQCILLRKDRYDVQEQGSFYLSPTPDVKSQFEGDSGPRTCVWAIVTDKLSNATFLIMNCHPDWINDTQRALQVDVIFDVMGEKMKQYPTIFCGDFNTEPTGPVYPRITQELMDSSKTAKTDLSEVDHTYHNFGESATFIDYIFYSKPFVPERYRIISDMYKGQVSDHYGIMADFIFEA